MQHSHKAIIIGSGVAGLAASIRLAVMGFEVEVFEKNAYPGGKLSHFRQEGYSFDAGPSLFIQPENIQELFDLAGEPIESYFQYSEVDTACKYFYEDGTIIQAYTDPDKFALELKNKIGEDPSRVKQYLESSKNIYEQIGKIFLNYSLHKKKTIRSAPIRKALQSVVFSDLFRTLDHKNRAAFSKDQTIQLFNRYATFNGSNPFKTPGMMRMIGNLEYTGGVYFPKGGMISITDALYRLALKKGVLFRFNSPVEKIIHHENKALGVLEGNENHFADLVVSNSDAYLTYKHLLNDDRIAKKIGKQERSSSAMIFYWGISRNFPELELHNIFFSRNYQDEFLKIFKDKTLSEDPTIYINITAKCEPGLHAPENKENWFVMINAPADYGQKWDDLKKRAKTNILGKLTRLLKTDIAALIETEKILDPVLIESSTTAYRGSLYGTSSNSPRAAFLRQPNFSRDIARLYFTGGSVHPGGGIPLCLKSAKIMCELIREDKKKWKNH